MSKPRNAGKKWSSDADLALLTMWKHNEPIASILTCFGRTEYAIASRLVLLDRYPDLDAALAEIERRKVQDASGQRGGEQ
ncbi:hypothetical protein [Burkholderia vietnamiensis]|uniref:hypothetical protein n=1 Tax=Burkholderia vietnamiensis TaxID=60552 RepID=UPI001593FCB7|nr:hypothetical protein [Burkholderia vietnamiensis]MCA8270718.1 hypothetical protein [Burkholderia vietnamiensis]